MTEGMWFEGPNWVSRPVAVVSRSSWSGLFGLWDEEIVAAAPLNPKKGTLLTSPLIPHRVL